MTDEKRKDKRLAFKEGDVLTTESGKRIAIFNIQDKSDKNRRKLYDIISINDKKLICGVTASQIKNMIDDVPKPRIKRNSCIDYYGTKLKFNDIDKELGLKKGSTIRYFNRNGRDEKKIIDRITEHRMKNENN